MLSHLFRVPSHLWPSHVVSPVQSAVSPVAWPCRLTCSECRLTCSECRLTCGLAMLSHLFRVPSHLWHGNVVPGQDGDDDVEDEEVQFVARPAAHYQLDQRRQPELCVPPEHLRTETSGILKPKADLRLPTLPTTVGQLPDF